MQVLLDTNVLLWALQDPDRLDAPALKLLTDRNNEIYFSAVSIWEISIKASLGRIDFRHDPSEVVTDAMKTGFKELPVTSLNAITVMKLPPLHKDPFDRLLLAQMYAGPYQFLTVDAALVPYSTLVSLVNAR